MKTEIPYNFMPAEQHFGSPEELLRAIEHYQQTRSFADGDKRFNAPEDKFEKLLKEDGGFVLMPIARDYAFLYRGQGGFYNPCLPTLFRTALDPDRLFLEQMRIVEFELMLKQYPSVQYFEQLYGISAALWAGYKQKCSQSSGCSTNRLHSRGTRDGQTKRLRHPERQPDASCYEPPDYDNGDAGR